MEASMKSKKAEACSKRRARRNEEGQNPSKDLKSAEMEMAGQGWTKAKPAQNRQLMEVVVEKANMTVAYERVMQNKGAGGVDRIKGPEFKAHLLKTWQIIKARLLAGEYIPQPVRRVDIAKPQGGTRKLGIPTLTDRLIQQALHQVLSPIFEETFSDSSYGYRPGKSAHQAVLAAKQYVAEGRRFVVDLDLASFFDRINHDMLMERIARKIGDKRVLRLIRRYLEAGVMTGGLCSPRTEGMPQGGPLSPLLSNILLTDLDRELERRGHKFCRYADDVNVYVRSRKAGERLMLSLTRYFKETLKLEVNQEKSAVGHPWKRKILGYSVTWHKTPKLRIASASLKRLKAKVHEAMKGAKGRSLSRTIEQLNPILKGWSAYFKLTETRKSLEELDGWIRHRLRCILWRQWKRPSTRAKNLMKAGLKEYRAYHSAYNGRGPWWNSGASHMNAAHPKTYFDRLGLVSVLDTVRKLQYLS